MRSPCTKQGTICTHLHSTKLVVDSELLEAKHNRNRLVVMMVAIAVGMVAVGMIMVTGAMVVRTFRVMMVVAMVMVVITAKDTDGHE